VITGGRREEKKRKKRRRGKMEERTFNLSSGSVKDQ